MVVDETRRRMRLIAPHIRRAVLFGRVIEFKKMEAATLADALDGISAGMLLADATSHIVHANAAAHAILEKRDVLRTPAGRLFIKDPEAEQILANALANAGNGDAAIGIKAITLPLNARDGERYVMHVLPLTSGARERAARNYGAVAALFVHKAVAEKPSPPEAIAKAYKLTPMQLRVLLAVVEVGGVPEVSEALGIAETTVKTHLAHLYEKTYTRRPAPAAKPILSNSLLDLRIRSLGERIAQGLGVGSCAARGMPGCRGFNFSPESPFRNLIKDYRVFAA
jgi:DNA-binding CsgD family transcriptional regulator